MDLHWAIFIFNVKDSGLYQEAQWHWIEARQPGGSGTKLQNEARCERSGKRAGEARGLHPRTISRAHPLDKLKRHFRKFPAVKCLKIFPLDPEALGQITPCSPSRWPWTEASVHRENRKQPLISKERLGRASHCSKTKFLIMFLCKELSGTKVFWGHKLELW